MTINTDAGGGLHSSRPSISKIWRGELPFRTIFGWFFIVPIIVIGVLTWLIYFKLGFTYLFLSSPLGFLVGLTSLKIWSVVMTILVIALSVLVFKGIISCYKQRNVSLTLAVLAEMVVVLVGLFALNALRDALASALL